MALEDVKAALKKQTDAGYTVDQLAISRQRSAGDFDVVAIIVTGSNFMTDVQRVDLGTVLWDQTDAYFTWLRQVMLPPEQGGHHVAH